MSATISIKNNPDSDPKIDLLTQCNLDSYKTVYIGVYEGQNLKYFGYCFVLNREIHQKVLIYVYLQFNSEFKENYLASTSLNLPLTHPSSLSS